MNNQVIKKEGKLEDKKKTFYLSGILHLAPTYEDRVVESQSGDRGRNECVNIMAMPRINSVHDNVKYKPQFS